MRRLISAVLYTLALATANGAVAADTAALEALREGTMKKLIFADPQPSTEVAFTGEDGSEMTLGAYEGKYVLLNFWATWCAPCRTEVPMLDELQTEFGGDTFEVVTIATGRNSPQGMKKFFDEVGVTTLPLHTDPKSAMARDMAVLGLPVTVILNPAGEEIARMRGDAEWNSESAKAIITSLLEAGS